MNEKQKQLVCRKVLLMGKPYIFFIENEGLWDSEYAILKIKMKSESVFKVTVEQIYEALSFYSLYVIEERATL